MSPTLPPEVQEAPRAHALCSPSSAERWLACTGSVAMEAGEEDIENEAAADGTLTHDLAAQWLLNGKSPESLVNDEARYERAALYVGFVFDLEERYRNAGATVTRMVEVKLPLQDVTGERNAMGTSDCVLLIEFPDYSMLHVIDLKDGYREVESSSPQLRVYALAAVRKYGLMHSFTQVHATIVQPRVRSEPDTETFTIEELEQFAVHVMGRAQEALGILEDGPATALSHLTVTEKGCQHCKARHKCPAHVKAVHDVVYGELQDIEATDIVPLDETTFDGSAQDFEKLLPVLMDKVPVIEAWCKYVRAKVEQLLVQGKPVKGYKLVQGRMGARKWVDEQAAARLMVGSGVPKELIFTPPELRTPADAEKKLKKAYPNVWQPLQGLITQAPGSPSVAREDDPRPALGSPAFDGESYDGADLV